MNSEYRIIHADARRALSAFRGRADLIITSPPYADARKRHYDSIKPDEYAAWFLSFHQPFAAALKPNGSLVINIKDKVVDGVRHRYVWDTVKALERRGWHAIDDYIWQKPNAMPGYWPTRLRDGWEYCFHLSRSKRPYIDFDAVKRPIGDWASSRLAKLGRNDTTRQNSANASGFGRNISKWATCKTVLPDNVLSLPLVGKNKDHPAVFPVELPAFFIRLLAPRDGLVIDPFGGSGTTAVAAYQEGRNCVLIDNNRRYCRRAQDRILKECGLDVPIGARKQANERTAGSSLAEIGGSRAAAARRVNRLLVPKVLFGETRPAFSSEPTSVPISTPTAPVKVAAGAPKGLP